MTTQELLNWQQIREWAESKEPGSRVGEACTNNKCPLANYLSEKTGHVWTVGPSIRVMGRDIRLDKDEWVQKLIETTDEIVPKDQVQWVTREQFLQVLEQVKPISEKNPKPAEVIIWQIVTDMPQTEHERKSYYMTLCDGEKDTQFILRLSADGTIVAEPYVSHEYDYDHNYDEDDEWDEEDDDSYYEDDEDDEEE